MGYTNIQNIAVKLGYAFKDVEVLRLSLRHPAMIYSRTPGIKAVNEAIIKHLRPDFFRLKNIGQNFVKSLTGDIFSAIHSHLQRTDVDEIVSSFISQNDLARAAKKCLLDKYVFYGAEPGSRDLQKDEILADILYSVIGAIYYDSGYDKNLLESVVEEHVLTPDTLKRIKIGIGTTDHKHILKKLALKKFGSAPTYRVFKLVSGVEGRTIIELSIGGVVLSLGEGSNTYEAQQIAASRLLAESNDLAKIPKDKIMNNCILEDMFYG